MNEHFIKSIKNAVARTQDKVDKADKILRHGITLLEDVCGEFSGFRCENTGESFAATGKGRGSMYYYVLRAHVDRIHPGYVRLTKIMHPERHGEALKEHLDIDTFDKMEHAIQATLVHFMTIGKYQRT